MIPAQTKRQRLDATFTTLWTERQSTMDTTYRDLSDHFCPTRARFTLGDNASGDLKSTKIIDSTPAQAVEICAGFLFSSISPQHQPWFKVKLSDPALMEIDSVKVWCDAATTAALNLLQRSNFYLAAPVVYFDQTVFATAACSMEEDARDVVRFLPLPVGSYAIGQDSRQRVNMLVREYRWSLRQVVERYGTDNLSESMKLAANDEKKLDSTKLDIREAVYPNDEYHANSARAVHKAFAYCVWEKGGEGDKLLFEGGFDEFPYLCPRYALQDGSNPYGVRSPGMLTLADNKTLQKMTKDGWKAAAKQIDPPLTGPASLENKRKSLLPGDFTADDATSEKHGLRPIHEVNFNLQQHEAVMDIVRRRIERGCHVDLALMLNRDTRTQPATAEEWRQRVVEQANATGPLLPRQNDDWLKPMVERLIAIMVRRSLMDWKLGLPGLLPQPPAEMESKDWHPEFTSSIAQAQKSGETVGIKAFIQLAVTIAEQTGDLSVLDSVNMHEALKVIAEADGVPPRIIRDEAQVAAMGAARAQAQARQQAQEAAPGMAKAAKDASETDTSRESLLTHAMAAAGSN